MTFAKWEGATECLGGPTPGALALMAGCLSAYGGHGAFNLGIYNCRNVRSKAARSCRAAGRACDVGFPVTNGRACAAGHHMVDALRPEAAALGIQAIIFDRVIYSRRSPAGRLYAGASPHLDHARVELTRLGGRELTRATVQAVLGTGGAAAGTNPAATRPELRRGSRGRAVEELQDLLGLPADGIFGPQTAAAVRAFQDGHGLVSTGIVSPPTWDRLLARPR